MKTKIFLSLAVISVAVCGLAAANRIDYPGAADSVGLKVLGFYLSESEECTNPVTVFENSNADFTDFTKILNLGGGDDVPNGTYKCAILKISDQVRTVVNQDLVDGTACSDFGLNDRDIFSSDSTAPGMVGNTLDGTSTIIPDATAQSFYLFFTKGGVKGAEFNHPRHSNPVIGVNEDSTPKTAPKGGGVLSQDIVINGKSDIRFKLKSIKSDGITTGSLKDLSEVDYNGGTNFQCEPTDSETIFEVTQ